MDFNLGITAKQANTLLHDSPSLLIVGYVGSGKSTLAEMLSQGLKEYGYQVLLQDARNWLFHGERRISKESRTQTRVDPEVINAMRFLEEKGGRGCWIIDDAEILLAYTTDALLSSLADRLRDRRFSLILVRNRFILEESGWLSKRQSLISSRPTKLTMHPLESEYAVEVATSMFHGYARESQGRWLASMSGGIPGLMGMLHPYTPEWSAIEFGSALDRMVADKRRELSLHKPIRQQLLTCLWSKVLPPYSILRPEAKTEIGALFLSGMVSPDYRTAASSFQGGFWELVSGHLVMDQSIADGYYETGLNLEIMLREAGLAESFCLEFGIDPSADGQLADSFAAGLYCQDHFPELVQGLGSFIGERIGKIGLVRLLREQGLPAESAAPPDDLAGSLLEWAKSR